MIISKKTAPFYFLAFFFLLTSLIVRIVLIFHPITQTSISIGEAIKIVALGFLSDFFVFCIASFLLWLYLVFISDSKYTKPYGYIVFLGLLALLGYLYFGNTIFDEYGGSLSEVVIAFVAVKTFLFGLLLFLPNYRKTIRFWLFSFVIFLYVVLIIQNGISEYLFWNEFGVRYNFIAVDYLIYTTEVIGNIMESYPVIPIFGSLFLLSGIITFFIVKHAKVYLDSLPSFMEKVKLSSLYLLLFVLALVTIPQISKTENSQDIFVNELQANGLYKFYLAFKNNELDYFKFYKTMPETEAIAVVNSLNSNPINNYLVHTIKNDSIEVHKNIMLITIESYSADFMKCYGNKNNLTPFLDSLATKSLQFTNLYAVGNRTVRGLEAVTLCLPPTAGESVIKRKDNKNKFTTGYVLAQKGYDVNFLYGGDAYFDNMEDFFGGNNYKIYDKKTFLPNEITFSNVWGVCDEDMSKKAIQLMNKQAQSKKPFFNHWMTVSNHRPFTYPSGKIDIPSDSKSRDGGVKYTDYALKKFFAMAQKQPWFSNTIFVILADHCASSAGKTQLPIDKYRIPALIYSPNYIKARQYNQLVSQIDLMPTLFGLLHFNYQSKFFGQDVLKPEYKPRAFIATYESLGYIKNNKLTVLSPTKQVKQFDLIPRKDPNLGAAFQLYFDEKPTSKLQKELIHETTAFYQVASYSLKNKQYNK